jgi:hypothetical protein
MGGSQELHAGGGPSGLAVAPDGPFSMNGDRSRSIRLGAVGA